MASKVPLKSDCICLEGDLARRHALPINSSLVCGLCAIEDENCQHLFFSCQVSWRVWMKLYDWLGIKTVLLIDAESHFRQHENLLLASKKAWSSLLLIWIAAVNAIWQCRNGSVFRGERVEVDRIVELVQYKVWMWLRTKENNFLSSFYEWVSNPVECLKSLH